MNDFTKTELQNIYLMACYYASNPINQKESQVLLMNKIQAMIKNYCEHDDHGGEVEIFIDTCKKCDAYVLREQKWREREHWEWEE